jgi:hypothetical protein
MRYGKEFDEIEKRWDGFPHAEMMRSFEEVVWNAAIEVMEKRLDKRLLENGQVSEAVAVREVFGERAEEERRQKLT